MTDKMVSDALGRLTADIAQDVEAGVPNPRLNPADLQKLKLAQQKVDQKERQMPLNPANDKRLAATVSKAVQQNNVADLALGRRQGVQGVGEAEEGKMPMKRKRFSGSMGQFGEDNEWPVDYAPKRDKDPRHPRNKGVSANRGFVGG